VVYIAKYEEAVYIPHAFRKKTQRTPKRDIDMAKTRLRELELERKI
jgi:phage-related protein